MTLTKEWLLKTISELEEERDATPGAVNEDAAKALAAMKMALASLTAEPVAWQWEYRDKTHVTNRQARAKFVAQDSDVTVQPLFAAPPAPVSVPISFEEWSRKCDLQIQLCDPQFREKAQYIWNACRAAMLQDAENAESTTTMQTASALDSSPKFAESPSGKSPAIPDGWVACSERMPEDEQEVLTRNKMGHCFVSFFDEHSGLFFDRIDAAAACCIEHILVTHWMPLPAAPQQEV